MTKRRKSFWLGWIAVAAILIALVLFLTRDPGPYYEGKPLDTYWFRELSAAYGTYGGGFFVQNDVIRVQGERYGHFNESQITTSNAIVAMGTNSLPFLLQKLQKPDSAFHHKIEKWLGKVGINRTLWRDARIERAQAVTALLVLGQNRLVTPGAAQRLRELSQGSDVDVAAAANRALQYYPGP
jgi:hypothetical protein